MTQFKYSQRLLAGLAAVCLLSFASCKCDKTQLYHKTWVLEKYGPAAGLQNAITGNPPARPEITLQLDGAGRFSGNDGCNLIGGVYIFSGDCKIRLDSIHSTLMFCSDSLIRTQAAAINSLIRGVNSYEASDNTLKLHTPGNELLQYRKR